MTTSLKLLTGIPRSGTTLCCKLLNQIEGVIALHEPIDPQKIKSTLKKAAVIDVAAQIDTINIALINGTAFEHGDSKNLVLDNPINAQKQNNDLRTLKAQRGLISLPPIPSNTSLFIKQNAMFAALASELTKDYELVAIIRNPINVIASWMSVDLPVNKGHIPGGEKFDSNLSNILSTIDNTLERQIEIYHWFISQYVASGLNIIKYEDIILSQGEVLYSACGVDSSFTQALTSKINYLPELEETFELIERKINNKIVGDFYSKNDITSAKMQAISGRV